MAGSSMVTKYWGAHTDNFSYGRSGYSVKGIVIHHAVTTDINVIGRVFSQPGRYGSAHYGVGGKEVHMYVDENDTAYHCSNWWGNCNTIGIETVNSALGGDYPVSDETLETLCQLVADIARRYNMGRLYINPAEDCPKLSGHKDWQGAATACPGPYLYARLQYICDRANEINYPPEPPKPTVSWSDTPATTMRVKAGGTNLVDVATGNVIKGLGGGEEFTYVQITSDGKYVRTEYSKEKNLNNGVLLADLEPIPEPGPGPEPGPEPEPEPTPNWFVKFIKDLIEFLFGWIKGKDK